MVTIRIALLFFICMFSCFTFAEAYEEKHVHREINRQAVIQSPLDTYLRDQLHFKGGVKEIFIGKAVWRWFEEGGEAEDKDPRPLNHFFDPLQPWDEAGLNIPVMATQTAALVWAQDQADEKENMSWQAARENFYLALAGRGEGFYAKTFQSLGQLMHLVADAAVPAHVRNDQHLYHELLPDWFEKNIKGGPDPYEHWTAQVKVWKSLNYNGEHVDPVIFSRAVSHSAATAAISALWDQNQYAGTNPEITLGVPEATGLAEYTNANFLSKDTIRADYDYPAIPDAVLTNIDWTQAEAVAAEDGVTDRRVYIKGLAGDNSKRLTAVSYLTYNLVARGHHSENPFVLDERIHADYAALLIPRAVGYSAALLDYFFSGSLEITPPQRYAYAIVDDADPAFLDGHGNRQEQFFSELKARVRLTTPGDGSQTGEVLAIARYKRRTDYLPDLSNEPPTDFSMDEAFSYSVSHPFSVYLDSDISVEIDFDFAADPIPAGITDLSLQVIFKGDLQGPIALGVKDLHEPMFFKMANSTDRYYHNGILKVPGDFPPGAPELELFHYPVSGSLGLYSPVGPFQGYGVDVALPPGRFSKIAFLTEGEGVAIRLASAHVPTVDLNFTTPVNEDSVFTETLLWRGDYAHQNYSWFAVFPHMDGVWDAPWPALQFPALPVTIRAQ